MLNFYTYSEVIDFDENNLTNFSTLIAVYAQMFKYMYDLNKEFHEISDCKRLLLLA